MLLQLHYIKLANFKQHATLHFYGHQTVRGDATNTFPSLQLLTTDTNNSGITALVQSPVSTSGMSSVDECNPSSIYAPAY